MPWSEGLRLWGPGSVKGGDEGTAKLHMVIENSGVTLLG